jgi:hypothetical protein
VNLIQIDAIDTETTQASFDRPNDIFGPQVLRRDFRRNTHVRTPTSNRPADETLGVPGAIGFGCIDQRQAQIESHPDRVHAEIVVARIGGKPSAQAPCTQADC